MNVSIGIDIGGTKCALSVGECTTDSVRILHREEFPTKGLSWQEVLEEFDEEIFLPMFHYDAKLGNLFGILFELSDSVIETPIQVNSATRV